MLDQIEEADAFYRGLIARLRVDLGQPELVPAYADSSALGFVLPAQQALQVSDGDARRCIGRALVCLGDLSRCVCRTALMLFSERVMKS